MRTKRKMWVWVFAVLAATALLVSCSQPNDEGGTGPRSEESTDVRSPSPPPGEVATEQLADTDPSVVDVAPLRQVHFDYEPAASPAALVEAGLHDAVVRGRLRAVLPGGGLAPSESDDSPEQYVILDVEVERVYESTGEIGRSVYVVLFQGGWQGDAPRYSIDDWNKALPSGTEMVLFLVGTRTGMVTGEHGIPADAVGMTPVPQGMILRTGTDLLLGGLDVLDPAWESITWDSLDEQLARATS